MTVLRFPTAIAAPLLCLAFCSGATLSAAEGRAVVSVLSPLAYGPHCWSSVKLQNLGDRNVTVRVEGHKGSGALVALGGADSIVVKLAPAGEKTLRLDVPGEESPEGWVKITEFFLPAETPVLSTSAQTECTDGDQVTTVPQTAAFPTRDPWLAGDLADFRGRTALVLNASFETAVVRVCYTHGVTVTNPAGRAGTEPVALCNASVLRQIPPFGTTTVSLEYEGNSAVAVTTRGSSIVLRLLLPQSGTTRTYAVDSAVTFDEVVGDRTVANPAR